jgi:hypothetical protein
MRAKAAAAVLVAMAALLVLVAPTGAGAAKVYHQPASVTADLHGTGTGGFQFYLFGFDRGVVFSLAKLRGEGLETVSYYSLHRERRPEFEDGRLDLKVGKLGHFRGHFVARSTKTQKLQKGCTGEPTTIEDGYFVGSFAFHGERGYTSIHADREKGSLTRMGAAKCVIAKEHRGHRSPSRRAKKEAELEREREAGEFRLVAGDAEGRLILQASREEAPRELHSQPTDFEVTLDGGKAGSFDVSRSASFFEFGRDAASTSFVVPNLAAPLTEATLEPPAPFSGSATFHLDTPKSASWTGDLAVELPGLGKTPLTGKQIYAGLCHGRSNCTKTLPFQLQALLEASNGFGSSVAVGVATTDPGS